MAEPLKVVATTPDLGALVQEIGGDRIQLQVLAKPTEDPHFVEAKPSFVRLLNQADLLVDTGLELEVGWLPPLLRTARNGRILAGSAGHLDASKAITPLGGHRHGVSRAEGDVHPAGNPHFLLDPVNGLRVAERLRERMSQLRPQEQAYFSSRFDQFASDLAIAMLGGLASQYEVADLPKLATLNARGKLAEFLRQQEQSTLLGGWFAQLQPYQNRRFVDDHDMWQYFAIRFQLDIAGHMEPKPGILPTSAHLKTLIELMRAEKIGVVITSVHYDHRHAAIVQAATGARVATLAHQPGAIKGTERYIPWLDYNVQTVANAFAQR